MLTTTEEKFLEGIIQRKISVQRGEVRSLCFLLFFTSFF